MTWDAYRAENPMLSEMKEYNTRVRDRVVLKKKTLTAPRDEEFTDRYKALGIPYPDPKTMCKGQCEGTGLVPIYGKNYKTPDGHCRPTADLGPSSQDEAYQKLWDEAEQKNATDDGWHFVKCIDCGGTGKQPQAEESLGSCIADLRKLLG